MSREAHIGLLGLLSIVAFFILVPSSSTRDSRLLRQEYNLIMPHGNQLIEGSQVHIAGFSAGEILELNFTTPEQKKKYGEDMNVIATIITDTNAKIPVDSLVSIDMSQTGNISLAIQPGSSNEYLHNGDTACLYFVDTKSISTPENTMINEVGETIRGFKDTLSNPTFRTNIRDLASNSRFYTNELKFATSNLGSQQRKLSTLLDEKQNSAMQQIDRINLQIDIGAARIRSLRPRLHESVQAYESRLKGAQNNIQGMLETAKRETLRFKSLSEKTNSDANKLLENPQYRAKLRKAAHKLENLAQTTSDIHCITSEPSVKEGLQSLVHQYRLQSQTIRDKVEKWERQLGGNPPNHDDEGKDDSSISSKQSDSSPDEVELPSPTPLATEMPQ